MRIIIDGKFNAHEDLTGADPLAIDVEESVLKEIQKTKCFDVENNCVIDYDNAEELEKQRLLELREKRTILLKTFDIYKSNVAYGVEFESDEERLAIVEWYNAILNLSEYAIENVPERIKYYL